jgi:ATP-binding cassette, subfamily F, member 3
MMISISISNATLILGAQVIFRNLNFEIQHDQKIGLVGANGTGKSSLFKLLMGEYTPEPGGAVVKARGVSLGYLAQQPVFPEDQTALQAALDGNPRVKQIGQILERIEASLHDPQVYNDPDTLGDTLDEQARLLEEYMLLGGDSYEERVREMLRGLGLQDQEMEKPVSLLSGGQKKLIGLAGLLAKRPPVLLLDEPDNHLDLAGKAYLERLIGEYEGAVVIVSHDRYLLDRIVTHIVELEDGKLNMFSGDYSSYISDKQTRLARQDELYRVQNRDIARLKAAAKRYAVWAKVYDSEKFAKRARAIENRLEKMDRIERPILDRRRMGLEFNGWRGSTKVLELSELRKSYQNEEGVRQELLKGVDLLLRHGERIGLIGANGAGKSVLLRLILGAEQPDTGDIIIGPSVRVGYYSQEYETLDFNQTLIDAVRQAGSLSESNAVSFLIRYLFTYRQATQRIGDLSGGERSRLQLALLVLSGANFLLLDEPTNNLDISSAEVLESALEDFEGSVLVISHDRYFLDGVVDRIVLLEEGSLREFYGGYSDYIEKMRAKGERRKTIKPLA